MLLQNNHRNTLAALATTALRVAPADTPCGVVNLAEGITIGCDPRLAWPASSLQRSTPLDASMLR